MRGCVCGGAGAPPSTDGGSEARTAAAFPERLDEPGQDPDGVALREHLRAPEERLEQLGGLQEALALEGDVAEHGQRIDVRGVERVGLLGRLLRLRVVLQLLAVDLRELREQPRLREVPLRDRELPLEERDDLRGLSALFVRAPERERDRRVARRRLERELVPHDRAVLVAAPLEEASRAGPLLRLPLRRRRLPRERLDRGERGVGVARGLAETGERLQGLRVIRREAQRLLVGLHRAVGRPQLVGEHASPRERELRLARGVLDERRVPLEHPDDVLPAAEPAVEARQRRQRGVVGRLDRQDGLARLDGLRVLEELLLLEPRDPLEEVDLLARARGDLHLPPQVVEQIAVAPRPVEIRSSPFSAPMWAGSSSRTAS